MNPWILIVCMSVDFSTICNVLYQFQFDTREMCERHRAAALEQNPQLTYAICVNDYNVADEFSHE